MDYIVFSPDIGYIDTRPMFNGKDLDYDYLGSLRNVDEVYLFPDNKGVYPEDGWSDNQEYIDEEFELLKQESPEYIIVNWELIATGFKQHTIVSKRV